MLIRLVLNLWSSLLNFAHIARIIDLHTISSSLRHHFVRTSSHTEFLLIHINKFSLKLAHQTSLEWLFSILGVIHNCHLPNVWLLLFLFFFILIKTWFHLSFCSVLFLIDLSVKRKSTVDFRVIWKNSMEDFK